MQARTRRTFIAITLLIALFFSCQDQEINRDRMFGDWIISSMTNYYDTYFRGSNEDCYQLIGNMTITEDRISLHLRADNPCTGDIVTKLNLSGSYTIDNDRITVTQDSDYSTYELRFRQIFDDQMTFYIGKWVVEWDKVQPAQNKLNILN